MPPAWDPARRQTANPQTPEEESPQTKERDTGRWSPVPPWRKCSPENVTENQQWQRKGWQDRWVPETKTREVRFFRFLGRKKNTEEEGRDCVVAEKTIGCQKRTCSHSICAETSRQVLTQPGSSAHQETANWGDIHGTGREMRGPHRISGTLPGCAFQTTEEVQVDTTVLLK